MDNPNIQKLKDAIDKNDSISVVVGKNPTMDQMAGALAFYLSLSSVGKTVTIACPTDPLVEISSLVGINKVKKTLGGDGGDLIVSFPYKEGEIEKVSYTLEEGLLNIIVKAGQEGLHFAEADVMYKRVGQAPKLLFVVGTSRLSDLGELFDPEKLKETMIVNIDNKKDNQGFGDIVLINPRASSVSEEVARILTALSLSIDIDIAQNLMSGISGGTENFQSSDTTDTAFEMAATLLRKGATRPRVRVDERVHETPASRPFFQSQDPAVQSFAQPMNRRPQQRMQQQPMMDASQRQPRPFLRPQQQQQQPFERVSQQPVVQQQTVSNNNQQRWHGAADTTAKPEAAVENRQVEEAPPDWLAPKVYKGSSNVDRIG